MALPDTALATAKRGPGKVVEVLAGIQKNLKSSRYQHHTVVRPKRGEYFFDCSGMAQWVLKRSAPAALRAVRRPDGGRPLARNFYKAIARVPLGQKRGAWYRVPDAASIQPGDVITWIRPPWFPSKVTGHVGFAVSGPAYNKGGVHGYLVRIADASRYRHEADTRAAGQTGFGTGVLLLATDGAAQPIGYGWVGSMSTPDWIVPTKMAIGRPLR